MLRFKIEWEDGPRVRDLLLRATWGRIEIRASGAGGEACMTDCVGLRSQSLRQGVYGSLLPIAQWVVENWWSLLWEALRSDRFRGGRALAADAALRPWVQRHNLLTARSGFALPDLTVYRDGDFSVLRCVPDPPGLDAPYPVRFVADAELRLSLAESEAGFRALVEAVAERLREQAPEDHPEAHEFFANWEAVRESARSEPRLCEAAAAMGLDPYNPGELTDEVVELLEGPFAELGPALRHDLAESATGPTLPADLGWVQTAMGAFGGLATCGPTVENPPGAGAEPAHEAGYERARWFRDRFGLPPVVDDLETFVRERCVWDPEPATVLLGDGIANRISALVGRDHAGRNRLAIPSHVGVPATKRFLLGRALFFAPEAGPQRSARLLTRASSWPQRASRAFAAELLAPSAELRRRVERQVTYEQVGDLARQFRVSEMVIGHQLENHGIARVVDL
jgi:hypothetical protein